MEESPEIKIMRRMSWERAKGELRSMQQTYCPTETGRPFPCGGNENAMDFTFAVEEFIDAVEKEGMHE